MSRWISGLTLREACRGSTILHIVLTSIRPLHEREVIFLHVEPLRLELPHQSYAEGPLKTRMGLPLGALNFRLAVEVCYAGSHQVWLVVGFVKLEPSRFA